VSGPFPFIGRSFCVALRPQPIDATAAIKPFVNFRLALKAPDVPNFSPGIVGFDMPLALCDTVEFEGDPRFAHKPIMPISGTIPRRPSGRYIDSPSRRPTTPTGRLPRRAGSGQTSARRKWRT
jgi:hypothetical protein